MVQYAQASGVLLALEVLDQPDEFWAKVVEALIQGSSHA